MDDHGQARQLMDDFDGLPESGFHDEQFQSVASHPDYANALRLIRDAALSDEYQSALLYKDTLPELFKEFSLNYCPTSLDVLDEWIDSGDCVKVQAAIKLLGNTYLGFYLRNLNFVSNYLHRAQMCGRTIFDEVEQTMLHCAINGPPLAMASARGERSNKLFHGAVSALQDVQRDKLLVRFLSSLRDKGQSMIEEEMEREAEEEIYFRSL